MPATPLRNVVTWDRADPRAARHAIRSGGYTGYTAAIAAGYVQANICILPRDWNADFLLLDRKSSRSFIFRRTSAVVVFRPRPLKRVLRTTTPLILS